VSAGRTGQCIATRPRPPQLLAPCHPAVHGARQGAGDVKKCSPKAANSWQLLAHFWSLCGQNWSKTGHERPRIPAGISEISLPGAQPASWPKLGPNLGHIRPKCGQSVSGAASDFLWGPKRGHFWPKNGPKMAGTTRPPGRWPISGQWVTKSGPMLANWTCGGRESADVRCHW
jgi:hypothetical protein